MTKNPTGSKTVVRALTTLGATLGLAFAGGGAWAATVYVNAGATCAGADGSAGKPFCTIQAGVNKAASGDTVQVAAGTYAEDVKIVNKGLKVLGADPGTTTVQGFAKPFWLTGFSSPASVEIAGFTITGGSDFGIGFDSSNLTVWVHNCILLGNGTGVGAWSGANARISNSVIANSTWQAVYASNAAIVTLYSNLLMNNPTGAYAYNCNTRIFSSYNRYFGNTKNRDAYNCGGTFIDSQNDSDNSDPKLVDPGNGDYHLQPGSPSADAGRPGATDKDPDGSRNDQGVYGGPGALAFWPRSAGAPVVTDVSSSPHDVATGGTFSITGTGKAQ